MIKNIVAGGILLTGVIMLISAVIAKKSQQHFIENMKKGKGKVIGYDYSDDSTWHSLIVEIIGIESKAHYNCAAKKKHTSDYPVGTEVDIFYVPKSFINLKYYKVFLDDGEDSFSTNRLACKILFILSAICLILSVSLFTI